jgi:Heterokaryon incompatibility protein (HET)
VLDLPPSVDHNAPLCCKIREAALDDAYKTLKYKALSYVWGIPSGNSTIICHGKTLKVTPNSLGALQHLRSRYPPRKPWVDAICIDQIEGAESIRERNQQAKLMGEVYLKVVKVLVRFGPAEPSAARTFRRLALVGRLLTLEWKKKVSLSILGTVRAYLSKSLLRKLPNCVSLRSTADLIQPQVLPLRPAS